MTQRTFFSRAVLLAFLLLSPGAVLQAQELEWVRTPGGDVGIVDITTDALGNSYVTGQFEGTATFGAGEANETVVTGSGMFVANYAADGILGWAATSSGETGARGSDIATDPLGNVYVTGSVQGTATFGAGEANETVLAGAGTFIAKYASDGPLLWATSAGSLAEGVGIATDHFGNSFVTGFFLRMTILGEGEANETVLITPGRVARLVEIG